MGNPRKKVVFFLLHIARVVKVTGSHTFGLPIVVAPHPKAFPYQLLQHTFSPFFKTYFDMLLQPQT